MANICGNVLSFAGDLQEIKALSKRVKEQDPTLLQIMPFQKALP